MLVADYAAKFEELIRFFPHYNGADAEESKCIKFESGFRLKIKQFIGYQEIHQFPVLVNKCHIYDEDNNARSAYYKSVCDKKNGNQNCRNPYVVPDGKSKQKFQQKNNNGKSQSVGGAANSIKCFKCGVLGHRASECTAMTCYKCGKDGHRDNECNIIGLVCYNYGGYGHISANCQKPKKIHDVKAGGNVFAFSGVEVSNSDNRI